MPHSPQDQSTHHEDKPRQGYVWAHLLKSLCAAGAALPRLTPRRLLASALCVSMLCTLIPLNALAAPAEGVEVPAITVTVEPAAAVDEEAVRTTAALIQVLPTVEALTALKESAPAAADQSYAHWQTEWRTAKTAVNTAQKAYDALNDAEKDTIAPELAAKLEGLTTALHTMMLRDARSGEESPIPTVSGTTIYANGAALILAAGSESTDKTVIYIDVDRDGEIDTDTDTIFEPDGTGGEFVSTIAGNDLCGYTIYGGSNGVDLAGDTQITMLGGKVGAIYGGSDSKVDSTTVTIFGGTVTGDVYGGSNGGTMGSAKVIVGGTAKVGGGETGAGIVINGSSVTNGVDSFIIGTDLAEDAAVYVNLPSDAAVDSTIATDAVASDIKYLHLTGAGAVDKIPSLAGTEIKLKEALTPTVDRTKIYANGAALILKAGSSDESKTVIYIDVDRDGVIDTDSDTIFDPDGTGEKFVGTTAGNDLSGWFIYGGSRSTALEANTKITMLSGAVQFIYGGCDDDSASLTGDTDITILGGTVNYVFGSGSSYKNIVTGSTSVTVSGGAVAGGVFGGGSSGPVIGSTSVVIDGGTVAGDVYGGGGNFNSKVTGTATVTITGGEVKGNVYSGSVTGSKTVTVGGIAKIGGSDTGIMINGTDNTKGVDSVAISAASSLQSDASIYLLLPSDAAVDKVIATNASASDVPYFHLIGEGADGLVPEFVNGSIALKAPNYSVSLDQSGIYTFTGAAVGYSEQAPLTVTVRNIGNQATGALTAALSGTNSSSFTLSTDTISDIAVGGNAAFTVKPHTGLAAGTYTATVTVSGSNGISASFAVSFTVSGGQSGGSDGGSSAGGDGSAESGSPVPPAVVEQPVPKPAAPTVVEITVNATVDQEGQATVDVSSSTVNSAINKALTEAKKSGAEDNGIALRINVSTGSQEASAITVNLPEAAQEQIIDKQVTEFTVAVDRPDISISLSLDSVKAINAQAQADVALTAARIDSSVLSTEAQQVIGDRPVFRLTAVYDDDAKQITDFQGSSVTVALPYTLKSGEEPSSILAVYVDGSGKVHDLAASGYDAKRRAVLFRTDHFSAYGVGFKPAPAFDDVKAHWAEADIEFAAARSLLTGTGDTTFSPDEAMTRAMFISALGRLADAELSGAQTSVFSDVSADAYYAPYVTWAAEQSITAGSGDGTFAPERAVTRQEMAALLQRYAERTGGQLPAARQPQTFADSADISPWAIESVNAMQQAGVLAGKSGGLFDPAAPATRAEAAAVLHRYIELLLAQSAVQR